MPGSPHFSVLKATESWVGPEKEGIDTPGVVLVYKIVSRTTNVKLVVILKCGACGLWSSFIDGQPYVQLFK